MKTLHATVTRDSDYFGASVAFSSDSLFITASGDASDSRGLNADLNSSALPQSGAFYLFAQRFVKPDNAAADMALGQAAAISGDTIVVGAINESSVAAGSGAVYVFH